MDQPSPPPLYVLPQHQGRAIIPKTILLVFLATIFYLGILLNVSLLALSADQETMTKLGTLVFIVIITIAGISSAIWKARRPYLFYNTKIRWGNRTLSLLEIEQPKRQEKWSDHFFKTYNLKLNATFEIKYIAQEIDILDYIEKLRVYAQGHTGEMNTKI